MSGKTKNLSRNLQFLTEQTGKQQQLLIKIRHILAPTKGGTGFSDNRTVEISNLIDGYFCNNSL